MNGWDNDRGDSGEYPRNWQPYTPEPPLPHTGDGYALFADDEDMWRHMGCASSGCNECRSRIEWHEIKRQDAFEAKREARANRPKWRSSEGFYWIDDSRLFKAVSFALKLWREGKTLDEAVQISGTYYDIHEGNQCLIGRHLYDAYDYERLKARDAEEQCR